MSNHLPSERRARIVGSMHILNKFRRVVRDKNILLMDNREKIMINEAIDIYQGKTKIGIDKFIPFCIPGSCNLEDIIPVEIYFLFKDIEKDKSKIEEICYSATAILNGKEVSEDKRMKIKSFLEKGMDLAENTYSQKIIKNPFYSN